MKKPKALPIGGAFLLLKKKGPCLMKYRFGSFNMNNMGMSAMTGRDFDRIAEIIKRENLDVVALQEILSEGKALEKLLEDRVKYCLKDWNVCWAKPHESSDIQKTKDNREEGYAYIWNTKRLALASSVTPKGKRDFEPRIIDEELRDVKSKFARTPYYARFVPVNGGFFEFRLINVHLHFGDNTKAQIEKRREEYKYLIDTVYPSISKERRYGNNREAYTIVMGDYNLNLIMPAGTSRGDTKNRTIIEGKKTVGDQRIITVQYELTTLKRPDKDETVDDDNPNRGYSQNYDHFSFDIGLLERDGIGYECNRIDAVRKYCNDDFELYHKEISDHIPIVLELSINETENNYE